MGETPFSMIYGSEVVIPLEIGFPTLNTDQFNIEENNRLLSIGLELIEERREVAMVKMAHYQQKLRQGNKVEATNPEGFGPEKSGRNNKESSMGKASP